MKSDGLRLAICINDNMESFLVKIFLPLLHLIHHHLFEWFLWSSYNHWRCVSNHYEQSEDENLLKLFFVWNSINLFTCDIHLDSCKNAFCWTNFWLLIQFQWIKKSLTIWIKNHFDEFNVFDDKVEVKSQRLLAIIKS